MNVLDWLVRDSFNWQDCGLQALDFGAGNGI